MKFTAYYDRGERYPTIPNFRTDTVDFELDGYPSADEIEISAKLAMEKHYGHYRITGWKYADGPSKGAFHSAR